MSELEHDILDDLYKLKSFTAMVEDLGLTDVELKAVLKKMIDKHLIRVFVSETEEIEVDDSDYELNFRRYQYMASKKGLKEYNSES